MKKSVALLAAFLAASLLSHSSQAEEREIKTTGGASLGKWKYDEIDPTDALLEVEPDGRRLISVNAGYLGNNSYRERWQFDNSYLTYGKLSSGGHYRAGAFGEREGAIYICGRDFEQKCDILESKEISQNLTTVTYRFRKTGQACAGLVYVDEEIYSEGYEGTYGDYWALSVTCLPASDGQDEALALSAHYLSLVKKNGRPIARLSRYNLPKPSEQARRSATFNEQSDSEVCRNAIILDKKNDHYMWKISAQKRDVLRIQEAGRRGYTATKCAQLLGFVKD